MQVFVVDDSDAHLRSLRDPAGAYGKTARRRNLMPRLQLFTLAAVAVLAGPLWFSGASSVGLGVALGAPAKAGAKAPAKPAASDMEFEPENATSTPPSKTLERAIKLYDKKDFFSASIELKKVLDGESGDDAKNKQRAEFYMGKTLYQLGFYAGSLADFDKIVKAGDAHTYHGATLKWLAALSRVLPETSGLP